MERIDHYEVRGELARGAMGVVYRAHDPNLERDVAIKVILDAELAGATDLARFQTEAQVMARLRHPNLVPVLGFGVAGGRPYFALELVEGESLAGRLKRQGKLPPHEAVRVALKIAEALGHAHQQGIVHRDVKPENVLFDRHDEPRLTDFGIAKVMGVERGLTVTGEVLGTPYYMAPEAALGDKDRIGPATDVYALGAVLFRMLTGDVPYRGASMLEVLDKIVTEPVVRVREREPRVDPGLDAICAQALAKDPAERFRDGDALAARLGEWSAPTARRAPPWFPILTGAVGVAAGLAAGAALMPGEPRAKSSAPTPTPTSAPARTPTPAAQVTPDGSGASRQAARALLVEARFLAQSNQHAAALRLLEAVGRLAPDEPAQFTLRAVTFFLRDGNAVGPRMKEELARAKALDPAGVGALILEATYARSPAESIQWVTRAIALAPATAWLYFLRSLFHENAKSETEMGADLDEAIVLDPRFVRARWKRALLRLLLGRAEEAFVDVERALAVDASNYALHILRAQVNQQRSNQEKAQLLDYKLAERFASTDSERSTAIVGRARVLGRRLARDRRGGAAVQLQRQALIEIDRAVEADGKNGEAFFLRAQILYELGERRGAEAAIDAAIERLPSTPRARAKRYHRLREVIRRAR